MKKTMAFLIAICLPLFVNAQTSEEIIKSDNHPNYVWKGDFSINASYTKTNKYLINSAPYATQGGEINLNYYVLNRFGFESGISSQHFKYLTSNLQETKQFDKKNLTLLSERVRYNFYQKPHCASAYI